MPVGGSVRVSPLGLLLLVSCGLVLAYLNMPTIKRAFGAGGGDSLAREEPELVSMKRLLAVAIEVAKRGGREVRAVRESVSGLQVFFFPCSPTF